MTFLGRWATSRSKGLTAAFSCLGSHLPPAAFRTMSREMTGSPLTSYPCSRLIPRAVPLGDLGTMGNFPPLPCELRRLLLKKSLARAKGKAAVT